MRSYCVGDWMSTPPITVAPTMSLIATQQLMDRHRIRRLPVVGQGQLVGIVTRTDLREAQPTHHTRLGSDEWRALLDNVRVDDCMTRNPFTVAAAAPLFDAARLMLAHKVSGLPVLSGERLVGMITESDLFRLILGEEATGEPVDAERVTFVCHHCQTILRRRTPEPQVGPDETCWLCQFHLHRCDNCQHCDSITCMLGRAEIHEAIPGRHCPAFTYRLTQTVDIRRQ